MSYRITTCRLYSWIFGFTLMALVFLPSHSSAMTPAQDITITPTVATPVINPGSVYHGSFQILNQGKSGYPYIIYSTPYRVSGEEYTPEFTVLPSAPNVSGWLNFSSAGGSVKPDQAATIDYTVSVPENTQPGGYYAAAFAETQFPKASNGITLNERVGELFYVEVAGPVVKQGSLVSWQSSLLQKPPLKATIRLKDSGSIFFPANINLSVKDILGQTKYSVTSTKELLPQTIREVPLPWDKTPAIGIFKVSGQISYLNHTYTLPTKWVLVMSTTVREIVILAFVAVLVLILVQQTYLKRRSRKKTAYKRK
jgi:hypothetical protein